MHSAFITVIQRKKRFSIWTKYGGLRRLLTKEEDSGTLERYPLWHSYFGFDIVHFVGINLYVMNAVLQFLTALTGNRNHDDEVSFFTIHPRVFKILHSIRAKQEEEKMEDCSTRHRQLVPLLPEIFALGDDTGEQKIDIYDIHYFTTAHKADHECPLAARTVQ